MLLGELGSRPVLDLEHGRVGGPQQRVGVVCLRGEGGTPDADADRHRDAIDRKWSGEGEPDAVSQPVDVVPRPRAQQDRELVAAETGDQILGSDAGAQPLRDVDEQQVSGS